MLVLSRKVQQQIQIGNNIVITILQVKGQAVRVGIEAPKDVKVMRAELPKALELKATNMQPVARSSKAVVRTGDELATRVDGRTSPKAPQVVERDAMVEPRLHVEAKFGAPLMRSLDRLRPTLTGSRG